jgi:hypothetical protein
MWLVLGCGVEAPDPGPPDDDPPVDPALQARIDAAIASVESDPCVTQDAGCEWADYEIGPAQLRLPWSTGEAILVIDELAGFVPELVRYRNRIRGYYRVNGDHIELQVRSVHLPRRFGDVLVGFADSTPAADLVAVSVAVSEAYRRLNLPSYVGHGGIVLSHLIDLVREQPLLLIDNTSLFQIASAMCTSGITPDTLAQATARNAALAADLRQLMTAHNVRFVNASFGTSSPVLALAWERTCGTPVPSTDQLRQLLHTEDAINDVLFHSDGVITAHAGANLGDPLDFPFDQVNVQYPNQVRIGFISSASSGLDEHGRGTVHKVQQFPDSGSADVYLNWGCEPAGVELSCATPHYQMVANYGLAVFTLPFMATSFINPLGAARLIKLRNANHAGEPMTNALIQTLKQELTPPLCGPAGDQPCVYQDPIAHDQLEGVRRRESPRRDIDR